DANGRASNPLRCRPAVEAPSPRGPRSPRTRWLAAARQAEPISVAGWAGSPQWTAEPAGERSLPSGDGGLARALGARLRNDRVDRQWRAEDALAFRSLRGGQGDRQREGRRFHRFVANRSRSAHRRAAAESLLQEGGLPAAAGGLTSRAYSNDRPRQLCASVRFECRRHA